MSEDREWVSVPNPVSTVGRGFVYFVILQYSVGIAIRTILERAIIVTPLQTGGFVSAGVVFALAGILALDQFSPSYRRLIVFSAFSLTLWWLADRAIRFGEGHIASLYSTVQTILIWVGAFLLAYALVFETESALLADSPDETRK
ncbi:hypothetical protein Har1130_17535 [Haloarcula sp. CBA1130]|uniref:hypothetical protein n=1 Tax=unclassified Haloarcula TaxID=2624677 RepID=UPI00124511AD|nr:MULTISPECIES: hypothetical protein [unclassified Haloarcula]KAA9396476.1 hypothetical protein Har1130_17535 [Haloarcula sp. CBA1130]KAA9397668.1 hypothetical protein Har1129_05270 [Haloarcula sp. CBA1129]